MLTVDQHVLTNSTQVHTPPLFPTPTTHPPPPPTSNATHAPLARFAAHLHTLGIHALCEGALRPALAAQHTPPSLGAYVHKSVTMIGRASVTMIGRASVTMIGCATWL